MSVSVQKIYDVLDSISPFSLQESWDNSGLQLGALDSKKERIYTTLEVSLEMLEDISDDSLIISHHPLFFRPLKSFDLNSTPANIAAKLLEKNCALISSHTNFDITHLNLEVANILGLDVSRQDGVIIYSEIVPTSFASFVEHISNKLGVEYTKSVKCTNIIEHVALVCGSGFSMFESVSHSGLSNLVFLTGDIKYHDAMAAKNLGVNLIDIGHFESERIFAPLMAEMLKKRGHKAIIFNTQSPFISRGK